MVNSRGMALLVACACVSHAATASITVISGSVDTFTNGTVGRAGSTSGLNQDDPPQLSGISGVLTLAASSVGGPVAPQEPLVTFPGTLASHSESSSVYEEFTGDGSTYMTIHQQAEVDNSLTDMDGPGLVGNSNAGAVSRARFSVNVATPYTLTGMVNLDNEDVSGFVRLNTALGIAIHSRFVANNGPFSFSGTLNPGTYELHSNCNVSATVNNAGVGNSGSFSEAGSYVATLTLGTPPACDSIDFNNDGLFPDTADIDDFLSVFSGGACSTAPVPGCGDIDFNNDGLFPDTTDIDSLLSVFSGGACL